MTVVNALSSYVIANWVLLDERAFQLHAEDTMHSLNRLPMMEIIKLYTQDGCLIAVFDEVLLYFQAIDVYASQQNNEGLRDE